MHATSDPRTRRFPASHARLVCALTLGTMLAFGAGSAVAKAGASEHPADWRSYGGNDANWHFSTLESINKHNVADLELAWAHSLGTLLAQESTPVVVGDTLFVTSSLGPRNVYALDATTGAMKWSAHFEIPPGVQQYACCGQVNRGPAYSDGVLYVGRLDGKLTALDAKTGKEIWTKKVVDYTQGAVITSPPLVVKDIVITGFGGGEYGVRGYLTAYDKATGAKRWQTYTVPGPGEPGNESWKGDSWKNGGGAAWMVGSYDAQLDLVYYGTSNPSPWNAAVRGPNTSDYGKFTNKWTAATLAIDPDTGEIVWGYQTTPHDAWDYDGTNELLLTDLDVNDDGSAEPVGLKADRNGFFYVLDRENGDLISAEPFVHVTWAEKIDLDSGRPVENPSKRPGLGEKAEDVCPNLLGGKNWQPMAYHPGTGLVYIPANNLCMDMEDTEVEYRRGMFYLGKEFPAKRGPGDYLGELIAWDPLKQQRAWSIKEKFPFNGGALATGGGLVFAGNFEGIFRAIDAQSGKILWQKRLGSGIHAAPVTYEVDGKQYVSVVVGRTQTIPGFIGDIGKEMTSAVPQGGMMYTFTLD